jgi:hypothetical protein
MYVSGTGHQSVLADSLLLESDKYQHTQLQRMYHDKHTNGNTFDILSFLNGSQIIHLALQAFMRHSSAIKIRSVLFRNRYKKK